jgi:DNA polymerase
MFTIIGEAPDVHDVERGEPFVGRSGALLLALVDEVLGLSRHEIYITHVVKCRPPHGAMVQAAELAKCEAYLQREIALTQPKIILAMGRFANQLVLRETPELAGMPLGKLRGRVYRYQGIPVVVTYHPKTLMRNSADKGKAWADLCLAADTLASPRP